ncbi:MAG: hypothetical protein IT304_00160 [Dehalococcoidia bacterium]|nr:hypothetical protein [Dehalococcoidia bacterium]
MSIAYGGVVAFLFRGMNLVIALATVILTSHQLSADDYGVFVLGLTVVGVANAVTGGLTAAVAYQVANQRRAPGTALVNGGAVALSLGLVAVLAGFGGGALLAGEAGRVALPVGAAGAAVVLNSVLAGSFLGREAFVRYNLALVVPPALALSAIAVTFAVLGHRSPEAALAAFAAGQWLALLLLALTSGLVPRGGLRVERQLVRALVRFALLAGVSSGVSYLNYRADLFVVRHFEGEHGVATYSLAVYIAESVWQVSGSLALAAYARMGALDRPAAAALTARVMRHTVVLLGVICVVLFAGAGLIESLLFGEKYAGMASALRFILPGVLLYSLAQSFSGFYTYQRGLPYVAALVASVGLVVDLALDLALVPAMGVNGAALASAIAYGGAILGALAFFLRGERIGPSQVFRFGQSDLDDYRALVGRLRSAVRLTPAGGQGAARPPV